MKVAINACFGGFSLSPQGIKRWAELKGRQCFFFTDVKNNGKLELGTYREISIDEAASQFMWHAFDISNPNEIFINTDNWYTMSMEDRQKANEIHSSHSLYGRDIKRDDPELIRVIEELGKAANGKCASLRIVEIPDGIEWEINEYDGSESVEEKHRSWS